MLVLKHFKYKNYRANLYLLLILYSAMYFYLDLEVVTKKHANMQWNTELSHTFSHSTLLLGLAFTFSTLLGEYFLLSPLTTWVYICDLTQYLINKFLTQEI